MKGLLSKTIPTYEYDMHKTYFNIHLVTPQDKGYLADCSYHRQEKNVNRHETTADPSLEKSRDAEKYARSYLSSYVALHEKTILVFTLRNSRGQLSKTYRELDGVFIQDKNTIVIFEIKYSNKKNALKKAREQLSQSAQILSLIYNKIIKCIVLVEPPEIISDDPTELDLASKDRLITDEYFELSKEYKLLINDAFKDLGPELIGVIRLKTHSSN